MLGRLGLLGLGVGMIYLMDPAHRERLRGGTARLVRGIVDALDRPTFDGRAGEGGSGSLFGTDGAPDWVIEARVRERLGRAVADPSAFRVDVRRGRVTLVGPIPPGEVEAALAAAAWARGVRGVAYDPGGRVGPA